MSIDFSKVTGISDHIGNIVKITDAAGNVLWAVSGGKAVLQVEKLTSDTYAGETEYTAESFVLLDIYPKTNGTVKVAYGGLTKTITDTSGAAEPNAQQVFFGIFNGVSDSVETPASGELTIQGDCYAFGVGTYKSLNFKGSAATAYCNCITAVGDLGDVETLPSYAFYGCTGLTSIDIPDGVTSIGDYSFYGCSGLTSIDVPDGVTVINDYMCSDCTGLTSIDVPDGVTSIGNYAFNNCTGLLNITIPASVSQIGNRAFYKNDETTFRTVTMLSKTPPTLGSSTIGNMFGPITRNLYKIIVPKGCVSAYENADIWKALAGDGVIVEAS